ncbi:MAG: polysaccharide deacetylase family protein [Reichenbachiella sp.]|uniref:polysaccharide deacetylase family protein n=1 Tax=Reichenbachiella sp. TaxID=2184521 RepID=UPI003267439C
MGSSLLFAQQKKLCITVDDLPVVSYGIHDSTFVFNLTRDLIQTFDEYQIPAIGYVNESKLYTNEKPDSTKIKLLELWPANGYDLGNHTYAHLSYHQTAFNDYTDGIIKGEQITRPLLKKYGKELRYFRHPYLQSGLRQGHTDSLKNFLKTNSYIEAPVTIDNADYLFAKAYSDAYKEEDSEKMKKIGSAYVKYMEEKVVYFEWLADELFGRPIAQTLLTHANLLNAHYLDDLAAMYVKHGYTFVSQEEVLRDSAYQSEISRYGNWGISWLDRWALSQGKSGDFFKGDPEVPAFIR